MRPVVQCSTGKKLFDTQKQAPTGAQAAKYVCLKSQGTPQNGPEYILWHHIN